MPGWTPEEMAKPFGLPVARHHQDGPGLLPEFMTHVDQRAFQHVEVTAEGPVM
jgi:hypothetical protein